MQTAIVFLIVAAAAAYAAWQLMPQGLRRWLLDRLIVVAPRGASWLLRLRESAESSGCSSCKACREICACLLRRRRQEPNGKADG